VPRAAGAAGDDFGIVPQSHPAGVRGPPRVVGTRPLDVPLDACGGQTVSSRWKKARYLRSARRSSSVDTSSPRPH